MEQKSNNKNKAIGGRPPLDKMEKRTEILSFKCTVLERHIINGKAMTAGVTLGEYIRNTAINGNITARLTPERCKTDKESFRHGKQPKPACKKCKYFRICCSVRIRVRTG